VACRRDPRRPCLSRYRGNSGYGPCVEWMPWKPTWQSANRYRRAVPVFDPVRFDLHAAHMDDAAPSHSMVISPPSALRPLSHRRAGIHQQLLCRPAGKSFRYFPGRGRPHQPLSPGKAHLLDHLNHCWDCFPLSTRRSNGRSTQLEAAGPSRLPFQNHRAMHQS